MLNDNRKIDYRNGFSFSFSCLLSILEMGTRPLAAPSTERLLASLLIKLKPSPQLTLHGRPSCVACGGLTADWPAQ